MLSYTDLKKGVLFVKDGDPYEVLDTEFSRMQMAKAVVRAKIRNLKSGKIFDTTFRASDTFEEADVEKRSLKFIYTHRGEYTFVDPKDPSRRSSLSAEVIGEKTKWLRRDTEVTALYFDDTFINLVLPIKIDFRVVEAPPGVQGDRAQAGTKAVTIETGAIVHVPPFINEGDIIRINTETGQYVERVEKA